tara:strand:- start:55 stop:348 length:294 start_codon:yes stop_codon:yes gene_type:complete
MSGPFTIMYVEICDCSVFKHDGIKYNTIDEAYNAIKQYKWSSSWIEIIDSNDNRIVKWSPHLNILELKQLLKNAKNEIVILKEELKKANNEILKLKQ